MRCIGQHSGQCVSTDEHCGKLDGGFDYLRCCIDGSNSFPPLETCTTMTCTVNYTTWGWNTTLGDYYQVEHSEVKCLSELSVCDTHPQCLEGEDEENCEEEYKRKGFAKDTATFKCQSPHHNDDSSTPTVFIWAVRCDGVSECWRGVDEVDCQTRMEVTLLLLGKP